MRAPLSETVKLNPAGAEAGVCGSPLEDDEELEENEADFVTDLSTALPLTLCLIFSGSAGLGGMSENEFGNWSEMLEEEKYMENALLVIEAREALLERASTSLALWS